MQVQVKHRLASLGVAVDDGTPGSMAARAHEPGGDAVQSSYHPVVYFLQVIHGGDVLAWDHQQVRWRLRVDVLEGDDLIFLVQLVAGNVAGGDPTEEAIV
jgi:hypothetical protein